MARTNNLTNYLTDIAYSIKSVNSDNLGSSYNNLLIEKKINADEFDTFIVDNLRKHDRTDVDTNPNPIVSYLIYNDLISDIDFSTSNINFGEYSAEYLFRNIKVASISGLTSDYLSTNACKSFYGMFSGCDMLTSLDISFDTSNAEIMENMFEGCQSITTLTLDIDTSACEDFSAMFVDCVSLETINGIDNFDVSNGLTFDFMFNGCEALTSLDLSNWQPSNAEVIDYMFGYCYNLTFLDVRNFEFSNINSTNYAFYEINPNCEIIVKDNTEKSWFANNYPELENVKTVAEYEA